MGYALLEQKSNADLQKLIRSRALDTELILLTDHVETRMLERQIGIQEIYDVLRKGCIERPWVADVEHESIECRMERYVGGRHLVVMVALVDEDPDLLVITTFEVEI